MIKRPYFILSVLLIIGSIIFSCALYSSLPDQVPTHWNVHGEIDDYGSKVPALFLMPALNIAILVLFAGLNWLSPKQFKIDTFRPTWEFVMLLAVGLLTYDHIIFLLGARGWLADMNRAILGGLFLFIGLLGNVLGRVRRNFWIGIRTPWTLANERVWNDTHRFAAKIFVIAGILGFAAAMAGAHPFIAIGILIAATLIAVLYSLFEYKKLERENKI